MATLWPVSWPPPPGDARPQGYRRLRSVHRISRPLTLGIPESFSDSAFDLVRRQTGGSLAFALRVLDRTLRNVVSNPESLSVVCGYHIVQKVNEE
jgi:hypothetical protein